MDVDNFPSQEVLQRHLQKLSKLLAATFGQYAIDLVVQRVAGTNESTNSLPEELAENLLQVNGVKPRPPGIIDYALLDLIDFNQEGVTDVLVNGWWPNRCPLFARFKFQAGGRPLKIGDENATVLGHELATKLGKTVGDKIAALRQSAISNRRDLRKPTGI